MVAQSAGPIGESSVDPINTAAPAWAALSGALWAPSRYHLPVRHELLNTTPLVDPKVPRVNCVHAPGAPWPFQ